MANIGGTKWARTAGKLLLALAPLAAAVLVGGLSARTLSTPAVSTAPAASVTAPQPVAALAKRDRAYPIKGVLTLDGPLDHGDYAWSDEGVPQGEILITVDLKAQTLSVFRAGYEIGVAVILYGADNKQSPLGTFAISQKDADHVSNLYDAPMPYMLRLTNDGVAIHGSDVEWGKATHGCIGVPTEFAALLFAQAKLGDRVIITDGQMMQLGGAVPAA